MPACMQASERSLRGTHHRILGKSRMVSKRRKGSVVRTVLPTAASWTTMLHIAPPVPRMRYMRCRRRRMFRRPHEPLAIVAVFLDGEPLSVVAGETVAAGGSSPPHEAFRAGRFNEVPVDIASRSCIMSRVAILGAGGIGCGAAALLSERGHEAVLWSPSGRGTAAFAGGTAAAGGGSTSPARTIRSLRRIALPRCAMLMR